MCDTEVFGCRIVSIENGVESIGTRQDMGAVFSPLTGARLTQKPVVYVFGPNHRGENCCVNVYDWYPYFYIDWPVSLNALFDRDAVKRAGGLYWDISDSTTRGMRGGKSVAGMTKAPSANVPPFCSLSSFVNALAAFLDQGSTCGPWVYNIDLTFRRTIYGYTRDRLPFFKIYLVSTGHVHPAASRLFRGEFYGIYFQPYDVHLVGLQFLMDHNLQGMNILWVKRRIGSEQTFSTKHIVGEHVLRCFSSDILNQYTTAREPNQEQDFKALGQPVLRDQKLHYRVTSPTLQFPTTVTDEALTASGAWVWEDPCPHDANDPRVSDLAPSLQDFWKDEVSRRQKLGQAPPLTLADAKKMQPEKWTSTVIQLVDEELRLPLSSVCPAYGPPYPTSYTSETELLYAALEHAKCEENMNQQLNPVDPCCSGRSPDTALSALCYSHPRDIPPTRLHAYTAHKKVNSFRRIIEIPSKTLATHFCTKSGMSSMLFYTIPAPSVMAIQRSFRCASQKAAYDSTGRLAVLPSRLKPLSMFETSATGLSNETKSPQESCLPASLSSSSSSQSVGLPLSPKLTTSPLSQPCFFSSPSDRKNVVRRSQTPFLNLLRSKKQKATGKTGLDTILSQNPSPTLKDADFPQFGKVLGLYVLAAVQQPDHHPPRYQHVPNPYTDGLLAVTYIMRQEREKVVSKQSSFSSLALDTKGENEIPSSMETRDVLGVVELVDSAPSLPWTRHIIPNSQETYHACNAVLRPYVLAKETISLSVSVQRSCVPSEIDLMYWVLHNLFRQFDPAMVVGFDINGNSIGYLLRRAQVLGFAYPERHFGRLLPRFPLHNPMCSPQSVRCSNHLAATSNKNRTGRISGGVRLRGRIVLNLWRLFRQHVQTTQDTLHGLASAVLNITFPSYPLNMLAAWWCGEDPIASSNPALRDRALHYIVRYLQLSFFLLDTTDLLPRLTEMTRFLGMDFASTLSRGSQFRTEALLAQAAHAIGYVLLTAAKKQVQEQPAVSHLPLVMEPESNFYWDPVVVLDFQSLYPSIMIAYNTCYSTCLGRLQSFCSMDYTSSRPLGVLSHCVTTPLDQFKRNFPTTVAVYPTSDATWFVTSDVRRGVLPALMERVISTRIAMKQSIESLQRTKTSEENNHLLCRVLGHRQYALKMFANCTYGYTTATYSGRMPCTELADAIVQTARRTLERAIMFIESHPTWAARVVYGDTDSLFVLLPGRSLTDAFSLGSTMAVAITALNPWPVELKMEKVYFPCCLQTKKRYVGLVYTSEKQDVPKFEAKGIETMRRDQCPILARVLRTALTVLFETKDISRMKAHLWNAWSRMFLMEPHCSMTDFLFYRELKLGSYAYHRNRQAHTLPPQAVMAFHLCEEWELEEGDSDLQYILFERGIRLPYVVVQGPVKSRVIDLVVPPYRVTVAGSQPFCPLTPTRPQNDVQAYRSWARQPLVRVNTEWYIRHHMVPTLQRFFNLLNEGISVQDWYLALPRATPASTMHPQQTQLKISAVHQNNDFEWIKRADHPAFRRGPLPSSYFTEKQRAMHRDYAAPNPDAQKSNATAHSAAQSTTHPATNLMLSSSSPSSDSSSAATDVLQGTSPSTHVRRVGNTAAAPVHARVYPPSRRLFRAPLPCVKPTVSTLTQILPQQDKTYCRACKGDILRPQSSASPLLCDRCRASPTEVAWKLYRQWNEAEARVAGLRRLCVHCAGSLFAAEACHNAFHCRVYTMRNVARECLMSAVQDIEDVASLKLETS